MATERRNKHGLTKTQMAWVADRTRRAKLRPLSEYQQLSAQKATQFMEAELKKLATSGLGPDERVDKFVAGGGLASAYEKAYEALRSERPDLMQHAKLVKTFEVFQTELSLSGPDSYVDYRYEDDHVRIMVTDTSPATRKAVAALVKKHAPRLQYVLELETPQSYVKDDLSWTAYYAAEKAATSA